MPTENNDSVYQLLEWLRAHANTVISLNSQVPNNPYAKCHINLLHKTLTQAVATLKGEKP